MKGLLFIYNLKFLCFAVGYYTDRCRPVIFHKKCASKMVLFISVKCKVWINKGAQSILFCLFILSLKIIYLWQTKFWYLQAVNFFQRICLYFMYSKIVVSESSEHKIKI